MDAITCKNVVKCRYDELHLVKLGDIVIYTGGRSEGSFNYNIISNECQQKVILKIDELYNFEKMKLENQRKQKILDVKKLCEEL
jgi:hypothetical protein